LTREQRYTVTPDHRKNSNVQFAHEIVRHQMVPVDAAQLDHDVPARLLFEGGGCLGRITTLIMRVFS
jgi:hypothetical protein